MSKENHSQSKPKEICVNCVNHILVEQHKSKQKQQADENNRYMEIQRQLAAEEAQILKRKQNEKKLRQLEYSRARQTQTRKDRERQKIEEERKRQVENLRLLKQKEEREGNRQQEIERGKKESFKRELEQQVRDQLERKKVEKKNSNQKAIEYAFNNFGERDAQKEAKHAKRTAEYKQALKQQIEDNANRARREKEQDREWRERQRQLENSKVLFEPKAKVVDARNDYLRQQIQERSNKKLRELEEERRKTEEATKQAEQEYRDSIKQQQNLTSTKMDKYMRQLNSQLQENRQRKLREKQLDKSPGFSETPEQRKQQYQDCDKCHVTFPKNYISIFDY